MPRSAGRSKVSTRLQSTWTIAHVRTKISSSRSIEKLTFSLMEGRRGYGEADEHLQCRPAQYIQATSHLHTPLPVQVCNGGTTLSCEMRRPQVLVVLL